MIILLVCKHLKGEFKMNFLEKTKELNNMVNTLLEEKRDGVLSAEEYSFILKICRNLEQNALKIRRFVNKKLSESAKNPFRKNIAIQENMQSFSDYYVNKFGDIVQIELPPLLRKKVFQELKHGKTYCENYYSFNLIEASLYAVLKHYVQKEQIKPYTEKCLLYIVNVVDSSTPTSLIPDTDNHEYQALINTITSVFLSDDSPNFVAHLHDTEYGDSNKTVVYIIPYRQIEDEIAAQIALSKRKNFKIVA